MGPHSNKQIEPMIGIKFFFGMMDGGHVGSGEWGWAAAGYQRECVAIFLFQDDI